MMQGSPEWYAARLGKVTASRIADLMARTKTGWGASRANYMAELLVERLTGQPADGYESPAMRWGTEQEPFARAAYEFRTDADVALVGFVPHPTIAAAGASPDGLVSDAGQVEIKCPNTATHIDTLLAGSIPQKYADQMQWQMACTGRAWCDFVSFDPRMPESMRLWVQRVPRSAARIADLEAAVRDFLAELDAKEAALRARYEPAAQEAA
jgi:putative phage-type endonuclease